MLGSRDPVAEGLITSLAKPGGNVTGNADMYVDLMIKRLQLLLEVVGTRGPVGYVSYQPELSRERERGTIAALDAFARSQGVRLIVVPVRDISQTKESDLESGFATLKQQGAVAALVHDGATLGVEPERVADLMLRYRMPSIMEGRGASLAGVLMTYSESIADMARRAAGYIDRVLRGAKPEDLPVAQATRFELIINLKTAGAMGVEMPRSVLLRADELIR